jgi:hypothetical protein
MALSYYENSIPMTPCLKPTLALPVIIFPPSLSKLFRIFVVFWRLLIKWRRRCKYFEAYIIVSTREKNEERVVSTPFSYLWSPWFIFRSGNRLFLIFLCPSGYRRYLRMWRQFLSTAFLRRTETKSSGTKLNKMTIFPKRIPLTVTINTDQGLFYCWKY